MTPSSANDELDKILQRVWDTSLKAARSKDGTLTSSLIVEPIILKAAHDEMAAYVAQAEREARLDEAKLLNARFSTVRDDPKQAKMIEGYMLARDEFTRVKNERLAELERESDERK